MSDLMAAIKNIKVGVTGDLMLFYLFSEKCLQAPTHYTNNNMRKILEVKLRPLNGWIVHLLLQIIYRVPVELC